MPSASSSSRHSFVFALLVFATVFLATAALVFATAALVFATAALATAALATAALATAALATAALATAALVLHLAPVVPADCVHSGKQQRGLPSASAGLLLASGFFAPSGSHHYAPYIYHQKRWLLEPFFKSTERTRNE